MDSTMDSIFGFIWMFLAAMIKGITPVIPFIAIALLIAIGFKAIHRLARK